MSVKRTYRVVQSGQVFDERSFTVSAWSPDNAAEKYIDFFSDSDYDGSPVTVDVLEVVGNISTGWLTTWTVTGEAQWVYDSALKQGVGFGD